MARIAGVDLPRNKHTNTALTYIYGIGDSRARRILEQGNVDGVKKVQDLNEEEVNRIRQVIESEGGVEGDLRKDTSMHIKRLIEIGREDISHGQSTSGWRRCGARKKRQEEAVQAQRAQACALWRGAHSGLV